MLDYSTILYTTKNKWFFKNIYIYILKVYSQNPKCSSGITAKALFGGVGKLFLRVKHNILKDLKQRKSAGKKRLAVYHGFFPV